MSITIDNLGAVANWKERAVPLKCLLDFMCLQFLSPANTWQPQMPHDSCRMACCCLLLGVPPSGRQSGQAQWSLTVLLGSAVKIGPQNVFAKPWTLWGPCGLCAGTCSLWSCHSTVLTDLRFETRLGTFKKRRQCPGHWGGEYYCLGIQLESPALQAGALLLSAILSPLWETEKGSLGCPCWLWTNEHSE